MSAPYKTHKSLITQGINHGFFGREGGVSKGQYSSLNAGQGSADDPQDVRENRARIAAALGTTMGAKHLLSLRQIHSREVLTIERPFSPNSPLPSQGPKADGMVTTQRGIALSALSADCGPVLFADSKAGVIGACHAGWRGALSGITDATIEAMVDQGAARENITAVLGPCISQDSYEVGDEFRDSFIAENEIYDRFFTPTLEKQGPQKENAPRQPHFDLKAFILHRLRRAGVERVAALPDCTYAQPEAYFSYRYNCHNQISDYGRNISAIMLS